MSYGRITVNIRVISDEQYRENLAKLAGQPVPRAVEVYPEVFETADQALTEEVD